jgi:hypothetical protein
MIDAYPLQYPTNKPRTPSNKRIRSRFKDRLTNDKAQRELNNCLLRLNAKAIVISTNMPLRKDGGFYSSAREPDDPGVAVYFEYKKSQKCFACDKYDFLRDNIWAIAKTIEAIRGIERWGTGDMVDQAFSGFTALPDKTKTWYEILEVSENASLDEIKAAYRRLAKIYHPDVIRGTGDEDRFMEIANAYEQGIERQ